MALMNRNRFLFVIVQPVVVFLLLEFFLRFFGNTHQDIKVLLYHPSETTSFDKFETLDELMSTTMLGFAPHIRMLNDGFILNSRSFRTGDYTVDKREDITRIATIGDSFNLAEDVYYYDTWSVQLERELRRRRWGGAGAEVFSLGVDAVGPRFELRLWEIEKELLRSDIVILTFFVGNDFTDEQASDHKAGSSLDPSRPSYVYRLLRNLYRYLSEMKSEGGLGKPSTALRLGIGDRTSLLRVPRPTRFSHDEYLRIEGDRMRNITAISGRKEFTRLSDDVGRVLKRFDEEVALEGGRFVVLIVPDEFQVDAKLRTELLSKLKLSEGDIDLDMPQRRLGEILDSYSIEYVDLLPAFRSFAKDKRIYFKDNTHWNEEGQLLAAMVVASKLAGADLERR